MQKVLEMNVSVGLGDIPQKPVGVVLAPTRELVIQLAHEFKKFAAESNVSVNMAYGGTSMQCQRLRLFVSIHSDKGVNSSEEY
ncbi:DEAD/DEAH box helicase [Patescibacteria group bacterium]|nr:MAG: DEAD/DEAH box helicase [Patescibacteria group bacterium]